MRKHKLKFHSKSTYNELTHYTREETLELLDVDPLVMYNCNLMEYSNPSHTTPFYVREDVEREYIKLKSLQQNEPPYNEIEFISFQEIISQGQYTQEDLNTLDNQGRILTYYNSTCTNRYLERKFWEYFCKHPKVRNLVKQINCSTPYSIITVTSSKPPLNPKDTYDPLLHYRIFEVEQLLDLLPTQTYGFLRTRPYITVYNNNTCLHTYVDKHLIDQLIKEKNHTKTKSIVAYVRDATGKEANIQLQIDEITKFAEENNTQIEKWYIDRSSQYVTINKKTMSEMYKLTSDILKDKVSTVIAYSKKRISYMGDSNLFSMLCEHKCVADIYLHKNESAKIWGEEAVEVAKVMNKIAPMIDITKNDIVAKEPKKTRKRKKKRSTKMKPWAGYSYDEAGIAR